MGSWTLSGIWNDYSMAVGVLGGRGCLNTAEIDFSQSGGWKVQDQGLEGSVPGDGLLSGSRTTVFSLGPDMV